MKGETTNMISCDVYVLDLKQEWENVLTVLPFQTYLLMFMPLPHLRLLYVGCTYKVIYIVLLFLEAFTATVGKKTLNSVVSPFTFVSWIESLICVTSLLSVSHIGESMEDPRIKTSKARESNQQCSHTSVSLGHTLITEEENATTDQRQNIGKRGSRIERAKKSKERNAKRGDRTNETYDRKTKYRLVHDFSEH